MGEAGVAIRTGRDAATPPDITISADRLTITPYRPTEVGCTSMARTAQVKNGHAPKVCETCGRPFEWRKKWERVWDEVRYCSDRCRRATTS
jgi:hypothetical protein